MSQTLKRAVKIVIISLCLLLLISFALYFYICKNDTVYKTIKSNDTFSFSVLLYDLEGTLSDRLEAYQIIYDCKNNLLKILKINTNAVIFKRKERARSIKTLFYENSKKSLDIAIDAFYLDLHEIIGKADYSLSDFYINMSLKTFVEMFGNDKNIKSLLAVKELENRDLELLNCLETIERVLYLAPYKFFKIQKNYEYINTNISKISFLTLILKTKIHKPEIMFCDMPVKYTRTRVEPNKQDIEEFLNKIYYSDIDINKKHIIIDVKNASKQNRMAEKVSWVLRANKFDVLDWGSFPIVYDKTIIKDLKGNFAQSLRISKIIGAGKVIISYNSSVYVDINVFVGKDCKIYDNLDKKEDLNGKH
jgi:hypothetical protein